MSGLNKNFVLSKGQFFFERFTNTNGVYASTNEGEEYFAQSKEGNINVSSETLDHYDADEGLNVLDEQVTTKVDVTGKFVVENITLAVLAKFFLSDGVQSNVITAASNISETFKAKLGNYIQLGRSEALPQGARNVTSLTVELASAPGTAISNTNNVNYIADLALGRVYLNPSASGITDGTDIVVKYSVSAGTREVVVSKDQQVRGGLRFIARNPVGGQRDFYMPLVNLSPDGDLNLKGGTEWQSVPFKFTALKKDSSTERIYIDGRSA